MKTRYNDLIIEMACQLIAPFILLFSLYVVLHGHHSPGGGFQGGAILAALAILLRLALGVEQADRVFPSSLAPRLGAIGLLIFATVGIVAMVGGGNFLDYGSLPVSAPQASLRYSGILAAEVGIALCVFGALLSIFDTLLGR